MRFSQFIMLKAFLSATTAGKKIIINDIHDYNNYP
jgi:hypothetical protein